MIRFLKENGYPCDLELKAEQDGEWYYICVFIDGVEKPSLAYYTKYPHETRKAFAKGFFAGIKQNERAFAKGFFAGIKQNESMMDNICYYCKLPCNELSANPSEWPLFFCHSEEPGIVKAHHVGCVTKRIAEQESHLARCLKAVDDEPEKRFGFRDRHVAFAKANIKKRIKENP